MDEKNKSILLEWKNELEKEIDEYGKEIINSQKEYNELLVRYDILTKVIFENSNNDSFKVDEFNKISSFNEVKTKLDEMQTNKISNDKELTKKINYNKSILKAINMELL